MVSGVHRAGIEPAYRVVASTSTVTNRREGSHRENTKSVQEVSKHGVRNVARSAIYDGAGSRIRTDDLLITNQPL
jgi:hypothetical protein